MYDSLQQQFVGFWELAPTFFVQTFLNNAKCLSRPVLNMLLVQVCCT